MAHPTLAMLIVTVAAAHLQTQCRNTCSVTFPRQANTSCPNMQTKWSPQLQCLRGTMHAGKLLSESRVSVASPSLSVVRTSSQTAGEVCALVKFGLVDRLLAIIQYGTPSQAHAGALGYILVKGLHV
eukprot:GHUV01013267.1.p2 GENE.GHUV01013267.1~~GHUV01013267.1.p2  ORF type:complete len:127 (-),score=13.45 GHUV01013267.1:463-843(-)